MAISFATDVLPMFRAIDIAHMGPLGVTLDDYGYMSDPTNDHENAQSVYDHLTGTAKPKMPPGGPFWSAAQLATFEQWMKDGYLP